MADQPQTASQVDRADRAIYDHAAVLEQMSLAFRHFALFAATVTPEEITEAQRAIGLADAVGFVVDPTRYRQALQDGSLERQRHLVTLFEQTRQELLKLFPNDRVMQEMFSRGQTR